MRQITQSDAPKLAQLIRATGLDDNPDPERIARVSLESNHVTLIETAADGMFIGFVDAFSTASEQGECRWEIDLLGVDPRRQGKGIGRKLIQSVVQSGRDFGAVQARALVRDTNLASQHVFEACGFTTSMDRPHILYVSTNVIEPPPVPTDMYFVSVDTLLYQGVWLEGRLSARGLFCAQQVRTLYKWDTAGVLIYPDNAFMHEAAFWGYKPVGWYFSYTCSL